MPMRVYFAGSIRGGRQDADLYRELIDFIKGYADVLTEHVGDQSVTDTQGECYDTSYIHTRDLDWLKLSDVMIAEVTIPSLGVGYEIATAIHLNRKVLCLYHPQKGRKLSAMIAGSPAVEVYAYTDIEEAKKAIAAFLNVGDR
jgi:hypothetical protein